MGEFFKKAFKDMAESAKAQHEVDKSNANFQEAKAMSKPSVRKAAEQAKRDEQIAEANARTAAQERINALKK